MNVTLTPRSAAITRYLTSPLSVLALWQPWATLCVAPDPEHDGEPPKKHETRHWYPFSFEAPMCVAIHAAKKYDSENRYAFTDVRFKEALKRCGFYPGDPRPLLAGKATFPGMKPTPLGAIVGVAMVSGIYSPTPPENSKALFLDLHTIDDDDRAFGYWVANPADLNKTRYAWRLANAIMLPEPVRHSGRQDPLYHLDVGTLELIHAQLRGMVST